MATYYIGGIPCTSELYHHGILGQKWGRRRFQNEDGSLTAAGRERYNVGKSKKDGPVDVKKAYGKAARTAALNKAAFYGSNALPVLGAVGGAAAGLVNPSLMMPVAYGGAGLGTVATAAIQDKTRSNVDKLFKLTNPVKQNEIRIKEGTEFKRTSLKESEEENERLYMALANARTDMKYYSERWPGFLRKISNNPDAKVYQNTYKVEGEIIAPSYQKRKEAAQAIISADKRLKTELGKTYAMDQLRLSTGKLGAKTISELKKEIGPQVMERYKKYVDDIVKNEKFNLNNDDDFKRFSASIPTSGKLMNAYIKELKKQGYGAVFDDNSFSFAPFIVFDSSMLKQIGSKELK